MSKVVQWKRGNTAAVSSYTGLDGEIVINSEDHTLTLHDNLTPGGWTVGGIATNIGNLYVIDNTIYSANTANTRIQISTGTYAVHIDGVAIVVGTDDGLLMQHSANSNIATLSTSGRGNGNISIAISANSSAPGFAVSPQNQVGIRSGVINGLDIAYGGNLVPTQSNVHTIGDPSHLVSDIFIGNSMFVNGSTVTTVGNALTVNGNAIYPSNLNIQKVLANNTTTVTTLGNTDLKITATNGIEESTVRMWANSGKMSFNTLSDAFDYNFNGYVSSIGYIASASDPYGYSFYDPAEGYSGLRSVPADGVTYLYSYIAIAHANVEVVKFIANGITEMYGGLVVSVVGNEHGTFPTAPVQFYDNVASYSQIVHQNLSNSPFASTDIVLTADNGSDTSVYFDLGIASSSYEYPGDTAYFPNDSYLLAIDGNILINSGSAGKTVKVAVEGLALENIVAEFSPAVFTVNNIQTANVTATGYVKTVVDTVGNLIPADDVGVGARAFVTDANTTTFASEVSGGGANAVPVFSNGTVWCVG